MHLIIGLGNPGSKYQDTRHNIGFRIIDELATFYSVSVEREQFNARIGIGNIEGKRVALIKPMTFMNLSGEPASRIANWYRISSEAMIVIHDDIDLAFGRLKIKMKGGDGGHKGIRSLIDVLASDGFTRLRIGIGRSESKIAVADYVLGKFTYEEAQLLDPIIKTSRDAVVSILCKGSKVSMNRFNQKQIET